MLNVTWKLKEGLLSIGKKRTKQESEEEDDQDTDMEGGAVWIRYMDHEKRGNKKT